MAVKKVRKHSRVRHQRQLVHHSKSDNEIKKAPIPNPKKGKTQIVAQEIKFARLLADNNKKVREKVLKNLKKWLTVRSRSSFAFTEADFMRLWKGLFYCMWMSDKPLVQEELAESLSNIIHCFESVDIILLYSKCALKSLATAWYGIDQYRIDKFAMLIRRMLRQMFKVCKQKCWSKEIVEGLADIIEQRLLDKTTALGYNMHIVEIFWEELAKISEGNVPEDTMTQFMKPFVAYLTQMIDERQIKHIMRHIFRYLIFQSDIGMDYMEKFEAWRQAGFPCGSIDAIEKVELSDDDVEDDNNEDNANFLEKDSHNIDKPLDPRAGRVHVQLPQLPFNPHQISNLLMQYKVHTTSTAKSRRQLLHLTAEFKELAQGNMPLGVKEIRLPNKRPAETNPKKAALRLLKFEKELYSDTNKRKRAKQKIDGKESTTNNSFNGLSQKEKSLVETEDEVSNSIEQNVTQAQTSLKKRKHANFSEQTTLLDKENDNHFAVNKTSNAVLKNGTKQKLEKFARSDINKTVILSPVKLKKKKKRTSGDWNVSDNTIVLPASLVSSSASTSKEPIVENDVRKNLGTLINTNVAWLSPTIKKINEKHSKVAALMNEPVNSTPESITKKRVKIALQRNTAQNTSEYFLQIRKSPAIPFDANKKPLAGVLKASLIPSPVNPFYRK